MPVGHPMLWDTILYRRCRSSLAFGVLVHVLVADITAWERVCHSLPAETLGALQGN